MCIFLKFGLLISIIGVAGLNFYGQTKCNLQIGIYEFKEDGSSEQFPVQDTKIKLVYKKTKKSLKINKESAVPMFADVSEGDYEIVISKDGFQKTIEDFSVNCSWANAENVASEIVFLWKGNSQQTFNVSSKSVGKAGQPLKAIGGSNGKTDAVLLDKAVLLAKPEYPKAARAVRATGTVKVELVINELGYVVFAEAVSGHPLLQMAAIEAAKKSKFGMTFLEKIPFKVSGIVSYNFVP